MDELTNFINHSYLFQDIFLGMDSCTNNVHLSSVCTCFTDVAYCHVFQRRPRDKSQLQIPNRGQRQYHSFTGHSPILLHEQLKLAGPARGLPGDHGDSKRSFFSFQHNLPPQSQTCGHEPCRASRNRPHQNLRSEIAPSRRLQTILLHRQNRRGYRDLFFSTPSMDGSHLAHSIRFRV